MESIVQILRRSRNRSPRTNGGFIQLFISKRLIQGASAAMLSIFVPIFLYETAGQQFYLVGGLYALFSILYALFLVPGMSVTNKLGFSRTLVLGGIFSVFQYLILYYMTPQNAWALAIPFTVAVVGFRTFHWVPYQVDFTLFTKAGERGKSVSLSYATIAFMGVVGPILAGFIVKEAGYDALFLVAAVFLTVATVSYALVPATDVHFDWGFLETWKKLFSREHNGVMLGEFANGAETVVTLVVWPIFLYDVLDGKVFEIGAVSTIVVGVTIILQLVLGRYLDGKRDAKERTLRVGSTLYALGWIFKIFVLSAAQIFVVGLYHNIVKIFTKTPYTAILYDMSAEQGKYIDEFTVLREIAGHSGRTIGLIMIAVLSLYIPIGWTFIIAAVSSLALNMVYRIAQD